MEGVIREHEKLCAINQNAKALSATQNIINQLKRARENIASDQSSPQVTLAKLQGPVRASFDEMTASLRATRGAHNNCQKVLDKLFRDKTLPYADIDRLSQHTSLINRAIYLHLLREGLFDVASTLQDESSQRLMTQQAIQEASGEVVCFDEPLGLSDAALRSMREKFQSMHHVLLQLKEHKDLQPAIEWARSNRHTLQARGSNIEFELCRLKYIALLLHDSDDGTLSVASQMNALQYAQKEFQTFRSRYSIEIQQLIGALAFSSNITESPYQDRLNTETAWDEIAETFRKEFCSLLELSAESPLYVATTAGAIALPPLLKFQELVSKKKADWTSHNELPVETPLPPTYQYHSIFVCPVSKEQSTEDNPPMILPCGHVICLQSLNSIAKGSRFKCPYCPMDSSPDKARRVIL